MEFPSEEDFNGQDCENKNLRLLYRVLNIPTGDFLHKSSKRDQSRSIQEFEPLFDQANSSKILMFKNRRDWLRSKIGRGPKSSERGDFGFKTVLKKSVHINAMRYRECLMEISMLCSENSIENFVDNLQDFTILIDSMSPTIVNFLQNSFNETRFTKKIKNIDWKQG